MFRSLLVLALVLGPLAVLGQAQRTREPRAQDTYVRIKIDLNKFKPDNPDAAGFPAGPAPGAAPMGPGGAPGGVPGMGGAAGFGAGGFAGAGAPPLGAGAGSPMGPMDPMGAGYPGMQPAGQAEEPEPPLWIEARVRVKSGKVKGNYVMLDLRDKDLGQPWVPYTVISAVTDSGLAERYKSTRKNALTEKDAGKLFLLAEWCLQRSLLPQFEEAMKDLEEVDGQHRAVLAYKQVKEQMARKPGQDDPAAQSLLAQLKSEKYRSYVSDEGHYILLTRVRDSEETIPERLKFLERAYHNYFYWFALKGKVLPPPPYRLVAVLEPTVQEFRNRHDEFLTKPLLAEGFLARRDNVVFLSARPLSSAFAQLEQNNQTYLRTWGASAQEVLEAEPRKADVPILQTRLLVQKVLERDAEHSPTSHEAIRQLLAATQLLPRNLATAEWLQYGIASFFEIPRLAYYDTTTLPSWSHMVDFKFYRQTNKLPTDEGGQILLKVISDYYIHEAQAALKQVHKTKDDKTDALTEAAQEKLEIAQSTAWSLMYHLMNEDDSRARLFAYLKELQTLPRDVEFTPAVQVQCFARAFDLVGTDNALGVNMAAVNDLAVRWLQRMDVTPLDVQGVEAPLLKERTEKAEAPKKTAPTRNGNQPNYPPPPGASPMPPGVSPMPPGVPPMP